MFRTDATQVSDDFPRRPVELAVANAFDWPTSPTQVNGLLLTSLPVARGLEGCQPRRYRVFIALCPFSKVVLHAEVQEELQAPSPEEFIRRTRAKVRSASRESARRKLIRSREQTELKTIRDSREQAPPAIVSVNRWLER